MLSDKQTQRAGDNSQLMQASTINIYNGIDENKVREICAETYAVALKDYAKEAYACANKRIEQFEDLLLKKIQKVEGALNAFADPSFQLLLTSAQKAAVATERDSDYDMLTELLVCRITKGKERKNRAGISRAVEIIDKIDDDALCALTVVYGVTHFKPSNGLCMSGLKDLSDIFEKIMYMELPSGNDWIDHLDILDAVRINPINSFKKMAELYPAFLSGYSDAGILKDSEDYIKAIDILSEAGLDSSFLVPNDFFDGYVKLPIVRKESINNLIITRIIKENGEHVDPLRMVNEKESKAFEAVLNLYSMDENVKKLAISKFMDMWDSFEPLKKLHIWWDSLPFYFDITHVGRVLAHANARRCDKSIPELSLPT